MEFLKRKKLCFTCVHFYLSDTSGCQTCGREIRMSCSMEHYDLPTYEVKQCDLKIRFAETCKDFEEVQP